MATREQVELRAYRIWQEDGCPEGSSLAHWFQAELELGVVSEDETENTLARLGEVAAAVGADDSLDESVDASAASTRGPWVGRPCEWMRASRSRSSVTRRLPSSWGNGISPLRCRNRSNLSGPRF